MTVAYRPAEQRDRDFVVSSWSSSYRTSYVAGLISMDSWADVMHRQLANVLDRPDVRTVVAVDTEDRAFLYGFLTADTTPQVEQLSDNKHRTWPAMLYYVFVKAAYRRSGIARGLFDAAELDPRSQFLYACKTPLAGRLVNKIPLAKWNPLVARFGKHQNGRSK